MSHQAQHKAVVQHNTKVLFSSSLGPSPPKPGKVPALKDPQHEKRGTVHSVKPPGYLAGPPRQDIPPLPSKVLQQKLHSDV